MFGTSLRIKPQMVKSEAIFFIRILLKQPLFQNSPFGFPKIALKYGSLYPLPVILAGLRHATKSSASDLRDGRYIIAYDNDHVFEQNGG